MIYENMLFSAGGGLERIDKLVGTDPNCANLILGIGQTGIRAMEQLKKKVFHDLYGDDGIDAPPRFDGIRFLGIDSDPHSAQGLDTDEFFCLADDTMAASLRNKPLPQQDPALNWLDLENTPIPMMENNHGGVRSLGRYLLVKKAGELTRVLHARCNEILHAHQAQRIQIFLLTDLTGTIGSSCYLDVCYLLRRLAEASLWNLHIYGYFFLPATDSIDPAAAPDGFAQVQSNARCYAALKELDYLMNLPANQDRFTMRYDDYIKVDTQARPVDVCFLLAEDPQSATRKVTEHILWALTNPPQDPYGFQHPSFAGHIADAFQGICCTPIYNGAYCNYFTFGSAMAEHTMTPLLNYLGCGFFQKFFTLFDPTKAVVSPEEASAFAKEMGLTAPGIYSKLRQNISDITLPTYDRKELAAQVKPPQGMLNQFWAQFGNDWLENCEKKLKFASQSLCDPKDPGSLVGTIFRYLLAKAERKNQGPFFAANMLLALCEGDESPIALALADAKKKLTELGQRHQQATEALEKAKDQFHGKLPTKARYEAYLHAAQQWFNCVQCSYSIREVISVLQEVKKQLQILGTTHLRPLAQLLDNLRETFDANRADPNFFTRQAECRCLTDTKWLMPEMDEALEAMPDRAITEFVSELENAKPEALVTAPEQLRTLVTKHICKTFRKFLDTPFHQALCMPSHMINERYTNDPEQLYTLLKRLMDYEILPQLSAEAVPKFPFIPTFDKKTVFEQKSLRIPPTFPQEARDYSQSFIHGLNPTFEIITNFVPGRFVLEQWYAGFPLYAYNELLRLKKDYDTHSKAGLHLHRDWADLLPDPLPYSVYPEFSPNAPEAEALLEGALQKGILHYMEEDRYIRITRDTEEEQVQIHTLFKDDRPNTVLCQEALEAVRAAIARSQEEATYLPFPEIRWNESLKKRFDMDQLLASPKLLQLLRREVERCDRRAALLKKLEDLPAEGLAYNEELDSFCQLLCYGILAAPAAHFSDSADTTALVQCRFINDYNEPVAHLFSSRTTALGRKFPLYAAFLEFSGMERFNDVRKDMESVLNDAIALPQTPADHCFAWELLERLNDDTMQELMSLLSDEDDWEVRRFYMGLRRHLDRWKENASYWPENITELQPRLRCLPAAFNRCCPVLDLQDGKILLYFPNRSTQLVYDPENECYRPLRSDMKVWDGKDWVDPDRSDVLYL